MQFPDTPGRANNNPSNHDQLHSRRSNLAIFPVREVQDGKVPAAEEEAKGISGRPRRTARGGEGEKKLPTQPSLAPPTPPGGASRGKLGRGTHGGTAGATTARRIEHRRRHAIVDPGIGPPSLEAAKARESWTGGSSHCTNGTVSPKPQNIWKRKPFGATREGNGARPAFGAPVKHYRGRSDDRTRNGSGGGAQIAHRTAGRWRQTPPRGAGGRRSRPSQKRAPRVGRVQFFSASCRLSPQ